MAAVLFDAVNARPAAEQATANGIHARGTHGSRAAANSGSDGPSSPLDYATLAGAAFFPRADHTWQQFVVKDAPGPTSATGAWQATSPQGLEGTPTLLNL